MTGRKGAAHGGSAARTARTTQVALLRGINVGRAKRIAMADLRAVVESLGHSDVRTLLNSGNVVFASAPARPERLAASIEQAVERRLGVSARVTVLAGAALAEVVAENPLREVATDDSRLLVAFLRDPAAARARLAGLASRDWGSDAFALGARAAYLWCAGGILDSDLSQAVGRLLGDGVTTRNWTTVTKLHALADPAAAGERRA
jgi:uncharacterized protein (DUF1697 family)